MMDKIRNNIVEEALTWLGTPWIHAQCVKGAGVDCGNFLRGVYVNTGIIEDIKPPAYHSDFALHRSEDWFLSLVKSRSIEVLEPKKGDVVLYKIGRVFSHAAIIIDYPKIIHAHIRHGVIIDIGNDDNGGLRGKPRSFFSVFNSGGDYVWK